MCVGEQLLILKISSPIPLNFQQSIFGHAQQISNAVQFQSWYCNIGIIQWSQYFDENRTTAQLGDRRCHLMNNFEEATTIGCLKCWANKYVIYYMIPRLRIYYCIFVHHWMFYFSKHTLNDFTQHLFDRVLLCCLSESFFG